MQVDAGATFCTVWMPPAAFTDSAVAAALSVGAGLVLSVGSGVGVTLGVSVGVGIVAGFLPAIRSSRLNIIDGLRRVV